MRKLIIVLCLIPLFGISQTKNVVSSDRYLPRTDKIAEFQKALAVHAQKYHTGNWSWRVFDIMSGPDAGGYFVTEGPNSWEQLDSRGNISEEHMSDFYKNVAPLIERTSTAYATYRADLSTVQLTDYADKIAINHFFIKPGMSLEFEKIFPNVIKAWSAGNQSIAVYEASSSGPPQYLVVTRYKQGWKERDSSFRKSFKERYITANGQGTWDSYLTAIQQTVESSWSELLSLNKELSSKQQ